MPRRKKLNNSFAELTWNDLNDWAGNRIVSRGKSYQQQGRVSELAETNTGELIAWVEGTETYAVKVRMDKQGMPDSVCTCPYGIDCKHGVATVLEYLEYQEKNRKVPKAKKNDKRLKLLDDINEDDELLEDDDLFETEAILETIDDLLKGKTKTQLIDLILELSKEYPEIGEDLADRKHLASGNTKTLISSLRREIEEIGEETGWQNYWDGKGHTPDYSNIQKKLENLLDAGQADDVLSLGETLIQVGNRQVGESHDDGETAMEIYACMPIVTKALEQSSLTTVEKLIWAVDVVLKDEYDTFEPIAEYLMQSHNKEDWSNFADRLLERLKSFKSSTDISEYSQDYHRDRLTDWIIHALEHAGRLKEIVPLCEKEAQKTGSYKRLVKRLVEEKRYSEAEKWISQGILYTENKLPGIASSLRNHLLEIRTKQKDWKVVAGIRVDEFVRRPSVQTYKECKKATEKINAWPKVRESLLTYLETGVFPWDQEGWLLPETGLDKPKAESRKTFPMISDLIDIAIYEKKPDQVLRWYDQRPKQRHIWYGSNEDHIATAVQEHTPDRAVAMWQNIAEGLIAQVKPKSYHEAVIYLKKAEKVMVKEKREKEWEDYINGLKAAHVRKTRLMELLDERNDKPILKKR